MFVFACTTTGLRALLLGERQGVGKQRSGGGGAVTIALVRRLSTQGIAAWTRMSRANSLCLCAPCVLLCFIFPQRPRINKKSSGHSAAACSSSLSGTKRRPREVFLYSAAFQRCGWGAVPLDDWLQRVSTHGHDDASNMLGTAYLPVSYQPHRKALRMATQRSKNI